MTDRCYCSASWTEPHSRGCPMYEAPPTARAFAAQVVGFGFVLLALFVAIAVYGGIVAEGMR